MKEHILALLIGIGGTNNLGEKSPYYLFGGRIENNDIRIEGTFDTSDKIEAPGFRIATSATWKYNWLHFGAAYSYRSTKAWNKYAPFLVIGAGNDRVELLFSRAINTPNNELKAELRIRLHPIELQTFYEYYNMTSDLSDHRFGIGSQLVLVFP
jgi:hypothetical protein